MLLALSLYRYALRMLITLIPGDTNKREEVAPQIQEVAPHRFKRWPPGFKRWPHRFKRWPPQIQGCAPPYVWCGTLLHVALCSVWGMDSTGGPHRFKRRPPPRVWCGTLLRVALISIQDPPDVSTIVGYILVIPTPGMLCRTPV